MEKVINVNIPVIRNYMLLYRWCSRAAMERNPRRLLTHPWVGAVQWPAHGEDWAAAIWA